MQLVAFRNFVGEAVVCFSLAVGIVSFSGDFEVLFPFIKMSMFVIEYAIFKLIS